MAGGDAGRSAERSSIEIKDLLRKLVPKGGNHKDRVRRLTKFKNYVAPQNGRTPEFFDDDIPLLFLGAATPAIYLDEDDELPIASYYGLLFACGMESDNNTGLKRSARNATELVKWLLIDWKEGSNIETTNSPHNIFAKAFLSLPLDYYRHMRLDLHVKGDVGDARSGSPEDACQIIKLILLHHLSEDGERPSLVMIEELLPQDPKAVEEFDIWSNRLPVEEQDTIKKNAIARQAEIANRERQNAIAKAAGGNTNPLSSAIGPGMANAGDADAYEQMLMEESENQDDDDKKGDDGDQAGKGAADDEKDDDSYYDPDENDALAAIRRRQKQARKEVEQALYKDGKKGNKNAMISATRWEESKVAREQAARSAAAAKAGQHDTVRDSQDAAAEELEREEEKAKILGRDPLGILNFEDYDLRVIEGKHAEQIEQALQEISEEIQKAEHASNDELLRKAILQKESLETLVERMGGIEAMEQTTATSTGPTGNVGVGNQSNASNAMNNNRASILPTNPKFDPILFLTLLHRKTPYSTLLQSLDRLSLKTDKQATQLQNLVRDNFPLFVRCAEGFEEFRRSSEQEVGLGVNERIEKLEAIAESAAFQAKKSFKPLLDNTSEVRKVQSALAVLNRVGPILQVPALMRQHIENRRYSQALKTYRRALVIDETCNIELLKLVKSQAEDCVRDARIDLERRLTQDPASSSIDDLLNSIRDLGELLELDVSISEAKNSTSASMKDVSGADNRKGQASHVKDPALLLREQQQKGIYEIGSTVVKIRDHPPALACLLLQAAHFAIGTVSLIQSAEETSQRIFSGESLTQVQTSDPNSGVVSNAITSVPPGSTDAIGNVKNKQAGSGNQWKYDVLDARVISTNKSVDMARIWLPRLVRIGKAAREDEKRRVARIGHRRRALRNLESSNQLAAFDVFVSHIAPSLTKLVEHAAFCALGSNTRTGAKYIEMTYGQNAEEKLRTLLRSPLPPSQSTKVGKELADLVELLSESSKATDDLRPSTSAMYKTSPLEACERLGDSAVVTIEKRRCIYAFDVCSRSCSNRAAGSGKFDADALLLCLKNLSEQLSRPEECCNEIEKGCELVIRRCCEGLAGYVRDRGDDARLSAVAECSDVISDRIEEVTREVARLSKNFQAVHDVMMEDIVGLESAMFDEYLESIRTHVANSVKFGWLDNEHTTNAAFNDNDAAGGNTNEDSSNQPPAFPAYLSASLLAIARCRAQVEQALGSRIRKTNDANAKNPTSSNATRDKSRGQQSQSKQQQLVGVPYQHLAMATVADGVIEGICNEIMKRKLRLKVRQADRLANELEFLNNTLKKFITSDETRSLFKSTLQMVCTKAGRSSNQAGGGNRDYQDYANNDGPDGLAAIEELERLGRVYVLCLGD